MTAIKRLRIQTNPDTCRQGLRVKLLAQWRNFRKGLLSTDILHKIDSTKQKNSIRFSKLNSQNERAVSHPCRFSLFQAWFFLLLLTSLQVSSRRYRLKSGSRLFSSTWGIKGPADLSKLSSKVIDFCRGFSIFELMEFETDGVSVVHGKYCDTAF